MDDREKYLKSLKKELDAYTKQLSIIQEEFKGRTGEHVEIINHSLQGVLQETVIAYEKLKAASGEEWEPIKAIAAESFNNLRASFREKLNTSANQVKEYAEQLEENCEEKIEYVAQYVRKNPFKSLLLAAGAGFIVGKILK